MPLKESDVVVCAIFGGVARAPRSGDKVEIRGFGRFYQRQRRIGHNPSSSWHYTIGFSYSVSKPDCDAPL